MTPALIKRVESARGPNYALEVEIRDELEPELKDIGRVPSYTSSLDAAVSLAKRVLEPGDAITIGLNIHHREWVASVNRLDQNGGPWSVAWGQSPEAFPALALVLAVLRAVTP